MTTLLRTLALGTGLALLAGPAIAAEDDVVARVGTEAITERDLATATEEIGSQFGRLPEEQRRLAILSALVDIKALAIKAGQTDLAADPDVQSRIKLQTDLALHNAYFEREGAASVNEDELRARYEKEIGAMQPVTEYHARHILLENEADAQAVIDELEGGAEFETLAQERSTGPTGPDGGDLGFFRQGQMVPPFEEAVMALEPGQVTQAPVQTQFGWHVIELIEEREAEKPAFEQVREQVQQAVLQERYRQLVQEARSEQSVEYVDPGLKAQIEEIERQVSGAAGGTNAESEPAPANGNPATGDESPAAGDEGQSSGQ